MKCLNKIILLLFTSTIFLTACGKKEIPLEYGKYSLEDNFNMDSAMSEKQLDLFAKDLCAADSDIVNTSNISAQTVKSAGVFDVNNCKTLYAYNINERVNPASLTKVMTALIVLENCNLDDTVTVGDVRINEDGVQLFHLKEGDTVTVRDLLYIDLVYSGNDASLALANYVSGSEEEFVNLMNQEAKRLGATNTNFANSHGLSHDNHYTTAYDLYLIFNAALKYEDFKTIINTTSIDITYTSGGEVVTKTINTTNKYLTGGYTAPSTAAIVGGKTGSTQAAGKCLILYSTSSSGAPFISIIMGAGDETALYNTMTSLCNDTVR